jgi:hypothetical protein
MQVKTPLASSLWSVRHVLVSNLLVLGSHTPHSEALPLTHVMGRLEAAPLQSAYQTCPSE